MLLFPIIITIHIAIMGYGVFKGGSGKSFAIASLGSLVSLFLFGGLTTGEQLQTIPWMRFIFNTLVLSTILASLGWYAIEIICSIKEKIDLYRGCTAVDDLEQKK